MRVSYTDCSLQRRQRTCLPTFNSSPSMVVLISVHLLTGHCLFHGYAPASGTEVSRLRDGTAPVEHFAVYVATDDKLRTVQATSESTLFRAEESRRIVTFDVLRHTDTHSLTLTHTACRDTVNATFARETTLRKTIVGHTLDQHRHNATYLWNFERFHFILYSWTMERSSSN